MQSYKFGIRKAVVTTTNRLYSTAVRLSVGCDSAWFVGWNGTEHYWRCHWPAKQTSPWLHSSKRTFWMFGITKS